MRIVGNAFSPILKVFCWNLIKIFNLILIGVFRVT